MSLDQYRLAASGERDGLWDWDLQTNRVHFSPRWVSMLGCDDGEVGNSPEEWFGRVHAEDQARVRHDIEAQVANGAAAFDIQHRMRQRNGTYRWVTCHGIVVRDDSGAAVRLVGSHADVTADHVADALTGLPNRVLFLDRLANSIGRAKRRPDFFYAVLLIELDGTTPDDKAGPTAADPLLTASARRLESCLRGDEHSPFPGDDYVVARVRGAQFAVLLEGLKRPAEAQAAAERALASLLAPCQLRGRPVFPRASVGIAISVTGYDRTEDVMRDADAALYRAKALGGNRSEVFDLELLQSADARLELEADLAQALERQQFLLFFQPVLEASSNRIVGLEALVRWQHPARGMISPLEFVPIAEQTGVIVPLGEWILGEACRQLKAWQDSLSISKDLWVSVNVSSIQLRQPGIVERVGRALRDAGLDPACLMLELTESAVMEDPVAVKSMLMQLRVMGVRIGIDDFGTGHSSFAYLHQFPADFLKVDQAFIRGLEARQDKAEIVGTVAGLAEQLGLRVIAEGIESEAGLGLVRSRRCEYVQGFLFSRPVDAAAAAELLKNGVPLRLGSGPVEPAPPLASDATPRLPRAGKRRGFAGQRAQVYGALAILAVLIAVGLAVRLSHEPGVGGSSNEAAPMLPAQAPAQAPAKPLAPTSAQLPKSSAQTAKPGVASPAQQAKGRAAQPVPAAIPMQHLHAFGSCTGILRITSAGVSFATAEPEDSFTFKFAEFQSAVDDDILTIKSGQKTYRFRAAGVTGRAQSLSQLRKAVSAIAAFRSK